MAEALITEDMVINEVTRRHPETRRIFQEFGVDSCCGGSQPIAMAAAQEGLEVSVLLKALNAMVSS